MSGGEILVMDNGSSVTRAGIAGADAPSVVIPSVAGNCHPIENGLITNWDQMTNLYQQTFQQLKVSPENHPILLTETPLNSDSNREKVAEIMFEKFRVPAMYLANQSVLALYAAGRTTGIVVDSGEGMTRTVPVYEGYAVPDGVQEINVGGKDVSEHLTKLMIEKGLQKFDREVVDGIKERLGYVALDFQKEMKGKNEQQYDLPDGKTVTLNKERFQCTEAMFNPALIGKKNVSGITETVHSSIVKCDVDIRAGLYNNIILCGGNTMFPGIAERINHDLSNLAPPTAKIRVVAPPERKFSVWIGGSILASLPEFKDLLITRKGYEEHGASVINKKK